MPKMKSNTPKRKITITRRPILIVIIILAIAATTLIIAKILTNRAADESSQVSPSNTNNTSSQEDYDNNPQTPIQYEGQNVNTTESLTGSITYIDVNNGNLYIGTNIDQFLSSGTCTLTLTKDNQIISKTTNIVADPTTSSCDGFTIPINEFIPGEWNISIRLSTNDKTGILSGKVTI